ncbi:MAG: hypothetical protein RQ723_00315 [Desulfuromonadales bacterium]|nr:hypothetical protein [Desulfuromonadales bacterium]
MERSCFVSHKGKQIFVLDCRGIDRQQMFEVIDECARVVRQQPEQSVLTLTIAGDNTGFDSETVSRLKELTRGNAPHVKAAAVVGITGLYKVVMSAVSMFSKRRFYMFDSVEDAKDFLADF